MGLLKGLLREGKLLLSLSVPFLLLPLPLLHPTSEAACAYVLIVTAVYWVSEAVPLGAAALVPAFLYPFFGVLRSSEVRPLADQPPAQVNARPAREGPRGREMHKAL
ncbi:solute carrier family 13 member 4 [Phyllostomus discolor]|uniref:Solute carrier family 13 member 4 n=1 Tax=Phyllostomus discolor TaxID=89673 RepID=A0A833Z664_9CHIR|nr:solute carrier family 13 member 4 [Phyllostomus discolor]